MADEREPPPLFDDEETNKNEEDPEDLFPAAPQKKAPEETKSEDKSEDIFAGGGTEVDLESPEKESETKKDEEKESKKEPEVEATSESKEADDSPPPEVGVTTTSTDTTATKSAAKVSTMTEEEIEEQDGGDEFEINITITDPQKIGDGMGAYMAYKVITKTTIPSYRRPEFYVLRRFSDFLGLHDKLVEKHQCDGRIIPPAPEKSVIGMTKVKMSKEDSGSTEFVEKRRASLERYLNRTAAHPVLVLDNDFRDFLETDGELPRATSTSALSGAGVMRLFSKMGDAVGKMTFKMEESDQWFEEKQQQIEALDVQLRKLHSSIEALVAHRKELATNTGIFAKSTAMLANAEEHTALSRALSQLAEIEEKVEQLHHSQADNDYFTLAEMVKDYVSLIQAVKDVFHERVKCYKNWKEAEANLAKKREMKAKLELARKFDKVPQAAGEITEWEQKVDKGQEDFEAISKNIRKEIAKFEKNRVIDFKSNIIKYLESLMEHQQSLIKYWESFLPEAKAIA